MTAKTEASTESPAAEDMLQVLQNRIATKLTVETAPAATLAAFDPTQLMGIISAIVTMIQSCRKPTPTPTSTPATAAALTAAPVNSIPAVAAALLKPTLFHRVQLRRLTRQQMGVPAFRKHGEPMIQAAWDVAHTSSLADATALVTQIAP